MGKPSQGYTWLSQTEFIGLERRTRGTETSQYPQEKKSKEIPLVVASERGRAQTEGLTTFGVVGPATVELPTHQIVERSGKAGHSG